MLHANLLPDDSELECDLCIVGGGAAGITIAHSLRNENISIVVLESGTDAFDPEAAALYQGTNVGLAYLPPDVPRLRMFGGSTNHWEGSCNDFDEIDFLDRPWVAHGGWPMKKAALVPYYKRAQNYVQIGPYDYSLSSCASQLGLPLPKFLDDELVGEITQHSPPTQFGVVYGPDLDAAANVRVILGATVLSLDMNQDRTLAEGVTVGRFGKPSIKLKARRFVLALGGIENARFLLLNGLGNESGNVGRFFMEHPYFRLMMLAPSQDFVRFQTQWQNANWNGVHVSASVKFSQSVLWREQFQNSRMAFEPTDRYDASAGVESFHEIADGTARSTDEMLYHIGNMLLDVDMLAEAMSRQKLDKPLIPQAGDTVALTIGCMMEQLPNPDSRVMLGKTRDRFGQPRVELALRLTEADHIAAGRLVNAVSRAFGRVGIGRVRAAEPDRFAPWPPRRISYGSHHMGTTRMNADPKHGVVDANLRLHQAGNVYVAGSSVFPTGSHVPPTLTLVAFALRLADHLKGQAT